jgi:hypothetical protein
MKTNPKSHLVKIHNAARHSVSRALARSAPMSMRATSFATYKDLKGYINCLVKGGSARGCLRVGDNGTGAWGANTAQTKTPMCALPPGLGGNGTKVKVRITSSGRSVICERRDIGPKGVVDLNPAALLALGMSQETELSTPATIEFV